jgi:uncharacterized protein
MADHPNAVALRTGYEAFMKGDMDTVAALFADDIAWHYSGAGPLAGDFTGKDAVFALFARLAELTAGTFGNEIHDLLANDEHAVVLVEQSWEQPHPYRGNGVHVWHVNNGIPTEAWIMFQDQAAADAAATP